MKRSVFLPPLACRFDGKSAARISPETLSCLRPRRAWRRAFVTRGSLCARCALLAALHPALAAPQGGTVVSGQANISTSGAVTNINQSTYQAIINWQLFSIAPNEIVNFNQPGPSAVTVNRVIGNETSVIAGALNATGQVFIINSAGVLFTKNAQVNVGGLVGSTLDITNANIKAGKYQFSGSSTASVVNQGNITARPGGYVALLGNNVSNHGTITATLGTVAMASGEKVTLNYGGNSLVDVTVDKGALNALVANKGAIKADGGKVILTARAADALLSAQVNNSGVIQAQTLAALTGGGAPRTGSIKLIANGGRVRVSGLLDASAPNGGPGGSIETSGAKVHISKNAVVTTKAANSKNGSWLIDPNGFTIAASGGDITGAALSSQLANTNVAIKSTSGSGTDGNINVNDGVSWGANTTLSLTATNNINIAAPITATGATAGLALNFGGNYVFQNSSAITLSGANPSLSINGQSYQVINTLAQLAAISPNNSATIANGYYALGSNINAGGVVFSGPVVNDLEGTLAGLNHTITNLTIYDPNSNYNDALISTLGATTGLAATVRDVGVINANVNAGLSVDYVNGTYVNGGSGATLVYGNFGTINNSYAAGGSVTGLVNLGGLVGINHGAINNSYANVVINGVYQLGGLVGYNYGTIDNSYANGPVYATAPNEPAGGAFSATSVGGLVGFNAGVIENSHATGSLTTYNVFDVGGLVGTNYNLNAPNLTTSGVITNSYATGSVNATINESGVSFLTSGFGGLAGSNDGGVISYASASGNVTVSNASNGVGGFNVGGLVGYNGTSPFDLGVGGIIQNSTATGNVTAVVGTTLYVGGLIGFNDMFTTVINDSSSGVVSGLPGFTGGLIGANVGDSTISGNTWNITTSGQTVGYNSFGAGAPPVDGITGINPPPPPPPPTAPTLSFPTQPFIDASQTATVVSTVDALLSADSPPRPQAAASAGTASTSKLAGPSLDDNVTSPKVQTEADWLKRKQATDVANARAARAREASLAGPRRSTGVEEEEAPAPRRPISAPPHAAAKPKGAGFGATIRSIEIEGKQYELQEKPGSKTPAPVDDKAGAPQ